MLFYEFWTLFLTGQIDEWKKKRYPNGHAGVTWEQAFKLYCEDHQLEPEYMQLLKQELEP